MTTASSHNDWSPLEEILIGSAAGAAIPPVDASMRHFFGMGPDGPAPEEHVDADRLRRVREETEEDLDAFASAMESLGVRVRRPDPFEHDVRLSLPEWSGTSWHSLMPRDCLFLAGSTLIEVPMAVRARFVETFPFRSVVRDCFEQGATWIAGPKPRLPETTYRYEGDSGDVPVLAEDEPLFDAANVMRCGRDLFFNVGNTGNRIGARWLQRVLGPEYRVHTMSICDDHTGTTLHMLKPGVLLANAGRLTPEKIPAELRSWKTLWFDDPVDDGYGFDWPRASVWISMNIVSLDEERVVVPDNQVSLIRLLEKEGFTVVPLRFRHGRTWGGGFNCCSLDLRRGGGLESYL